MKLQDVNRRQISFVFSLVYVWVVLIHLGALVFETLIIYPDIFHDVPHSLEVAMEFMVIRGPGDFFPPIGMLGLLSGVATLIFGWRMKSARYWILGSVLLMVIGEFLLSALYFWPRNSIMFTEGAAVHSTAYLQQTAQEFQTGHWLRFGASAVASMLAFTGFLRLYRDRISARIRREISPTDFREEP